MQETIASIVVSQYLSLLRSMATERVVQSRVDLAQALLHLANDQVAQGTGTSTDALRANVELHVEKENLVAAQADTRGFGYGLAQILGLNADQHVVATDELNAHDEDVPDEQQSLADALTDHPDLSALILEAATKEHLRMPATESAFYVNSEELAGGGDEDFSAVLWRMEEIAGIPNQSVSGAT
jgi:outer membrane protein TolC